MASNKERDKWHKHPLMVMVIGGFVLWLVQFTITSANKAEEKKTEHYQYILRQKIQTYYELQKLSNIMFNQVRLLNKLVEMKNSGFAIPFDYQKAFMKQCEKFFDARVAFVNYHYENFMVQSEDAKKVYEDLVRYTSDEIRPREVKAVPNRCLGSTNANPDYYDFEVSSKIGTREFADESLKKWLTYVETLADELRFDNINHDINLLQKHED